MPSGRLHSPYLIFILDTSTSICLSNHPRCRGCGIRTGKEKLEGGFIDVGKYWMVNHYQDQRDRFLGWLILQPIEHRMSASEMSPEELKEFGIASERVERALIQAYNIVYPTDKVEIVYLARLAESTLGELPEWHLHWHMTPRTPTMKKNCVLGWNIEKCRWKGVKLNPSISEIESFMKLLGESLGNHIV